MSETHDYDTVKIKVEDLENNPETSHVLVGECGGLSAVFHNDGYDEVVRMVLIETEHGDLWFPPGTLVEVLA